ncbi:hypothetical protein NC653_018587 [Populus alba x Populus x berolinensis]|uniref:Uncharacterized protein n=1 Tax=Populus alba x Populus x berolinensis TaxID=444605 RepID=A0AAD6QGT7_9ROSI|nr:hypothetical protein NC653_018587 [Populus alba x Populus x berolinensis]
MRVVAKKRYGSREPSVWAFELAQQGFERMPSMKVAHGLLWIVDMFCLTLVLEMLPIGNQIRKELLELEPYSSWLYFQKLQESLELWYVALRASASDMVPKDVQNPCDTKNQLHHGCHVWVCYLGMTMVPQHFLFSRRSSWSAAAKTN